MGTLKSEASDAWRVLAGYVMPRSGRPSIYISIDLFGLSHLLLWALSAYLFYQQASGVYPADTRAHIFIALGNIDAGGAAYSLLHIVLRTLARLVEASGINATLDVLYSILITAVLTISVACTSLILIGYFRKYAEKYPFQAGFVPIALMVVAMLIVPDESRAIYLGTGTPNPWHNPTYILSKPFSIAVFLVLFGLLSARTSRLVFGWRLVLLAVLAVLSMWAKPSFLMSFLPAVAVYLGWQCLRGRVSLRLLLSVGVALGFSLLPLIDIQALVYGSNPDGGVIVTLGDVWRSYSSNIPLSIALGMAFPFFVVFVHRRHLSPQLVLASINWLFAALTYFFLAEQGARFTHGNFSWGYLFGMLMMFLASSEAFFFDPVGGRRIRIVGWTLFVAHVMCGIYYFATLLGGGEYL